MTTECSKKSPLSSGVNEELHKIEDCYTYRKEQDMNKPASQNQYVDNKKLYEAMKVYITAYRNAPDDGKPQISPYIGECILLIAQNLSRFYKFSGYSFRDEMVSDGYLACVAYLHNFDIDKWTNPHAYITKICFYAFVRRITVERKQQYVKLKNVQHYITFEELQETGVINTDMYNNNYDFINSYESKLEEKKKKTKPVGIDKFIEA